MLFSLIVVRKLKGIRISSYVSTSECVSMFQKKKRQNRYKMSCMMPEVHFCQFWNVFSFLLFSTSLWQLRSLCKDVLILLTYQIKEWRKIVPVLIHRYSILEYHQGIQLATSTTWNLSWNCNTDGVRVKITLKKVTWYLCKN